MDWNKFKFQQNTALFYLDLCALNEDHLFSCEQYVDRKILRYYSMWGKTLLSRLWEWEKERKIQKSWFYIKGNWQLSFMQNISQIKWIKYVIFPEIAIMRMSKKSEKYFFFAHLPELQLSMSAEVRNWSQKLESETGVRNWSQKLESETGVRNWSQKLESETKVR